MRIIITLNSKRRGRILSCGLILCLALSMLASSWRSTTSQASQKELPASTDTPENTYTFSNPANITIPVQGQAAPYPSTINVSNVPSTIEKLTVTLTNFTHTFPADVDILLVGPGGQSFLLFSDTGGGTGISNVNLTFDDTATAVPVAPITSGTYKPSNTDLNDTFPAPAPAGPYQSPGPQGTATFASVFGGTQPNGTWSLYVIDDLGGDSGMIAGGWSITITNSITAQNTQAIDFPDSGAAALYPSSFNVTGQIGPVTSVSVILNNFTHTSPDDVDLLLVAPGGRSVVVMSDVGGSNPVSNISLTLSDTAANSLPDEGTLTVGTYKPTNVGAGDTFPSPAPSSPPTGTTLSTFNGINPNGVWSLYAVDDAGGNVGSISGGWSLALTTSATACSLNLSSNLQVVPFTGGNGNFDLDSPFGCDWTATSLSSFVHITSGASGSGGNATITYMVDPNMGAGRTGQIRVMNASVTRTFTVQQPSGCPFSLSQETVNFSSSGGAGNINVTAGGACGWEATTKDSWITINSGTGTGNGSVSFTVAANNTGTQRTGTVTIGARTLTIIQSGAGKTLFDFDGDGKADLSVFRPSAASWYISNSSNGANNTQQFGLSTDNLAPADYDGDGKADLAVFRSGAWYVLRSSNGSIRSDQWGVSGDLIAPADYDGDGKADLAVWRPSNGTWYIAKSSDGSFVIQQFGIGGDKPVAGDYDGDGKSDLAVFRPSTGTWYVFRSSDAGVQATPFGLSTDVLVQADYDGDNKTDLAVYRNGTWYIQRSSAGFTSYQFGLNTDIPVAADYDGDHKADVAVFRQGNWYILQSSNGVSRSELWGMNGDAAVPAAFISN
jgi:subtilisin-like proprotein convertase family protein